MNIKPTWQNSRTIRNCLIIINILIPLLIVAAIVIAKGKKIADIVPGTADATWWWQQAAAVSSKYGRPLGYWGYNGNTAQWGTFAAWGMMAVMPYGLFGKIFGWTWNTFVYANVFYQSVAIALFIKLSRIKTKGLVFLLPINLMQVIRNVYLITAMQETVRCSAALIAVGLILWIHDHEGPNDRIYRFRVVLIGLYIFIIGQCYLVLTLFFFPFFYLIHFPNAGGNSENRKSPWKSTALIFSESIVCMIVSRIL